MERKNWKRNADGMQMMEMNAENRNGTQMERRAENIQHYFAKRSLHELTSKEFTWLDVQLWKPTLEIFSANKDKIGNLLQHMNLRFFVDGFLILFMAVSTPGGFP